MSAPLKERLLGWLKRLLPHLVSAVALLLIAMMYFLGVYSERTGFVDQVLDPGIKRITHPVLNAFRGKPPEVPMIRLTIAAADHDSLDRIRRSAIEAGWLEPDLNALFTAQALVDDRNMVALAGLRDGPTDLLSGKRWPLHMRLAEEDTVKGMASFDLVPVTDGRALRSWLFQRVLHVEGMPCLGHAFVEVRLNDRDMGLYAMEGRVDPLQVRRWARGPGPVVRFDDGLLVNARRAMGQRSFPSEPPRQADWLVAPILAARLNVVLEDPEGARRFQSAVLRLEAFRNGSLPPSAVFDADAMARLLALADLFGATEAVEWWSMRFLADSLSGKLTALPQRGHAGEPISGLLVTRTSETIRFPYRGSGYLDRLFGDTVIYLRYIAHLDTISRQGWLEDLLERIGPDLATRQRIVKAELPGASIDTTVFLHDRMVIRQTLRPRDLVLAYTQIGSIRHHVVAANVHVLPVIVDAVVAGTDTLYLLKPMILWPREVGKPLNYTLVPWDGILEPDIPLSLLVSIWGLPDRRPVAVRTWSTFPAN